MASACPPGFSNASGGDYTLATNSQMIDKGVPIAGINDGYGGLAPDLGAFEFTPALSVGAVAGDHTIAVNWSLNASLPGNATWRVSYTGPTASPASPVTGLANATRSQIFTNATNYSAYTFTINALVDGTAIYTGTAPPWQPISALHLPLVRK